MKKLNKLSECFYISLGIVIYLSTLVACTSECPPNASEYLRWKTVYLPASAHLTYEPIPFRPEKISCDIHQIPEASSYFQKVFHHPDGDLYFMSHVDEILAPAKKWAADGDPESIFTVGNMKYAAWKLEWLKLRRNSNNHSTRQPFPDEVKDDITAAVAYIELASHLNGPQKDVARELARDIEGNEHDLTVPPAWISEAKADVEIWRTKCNGQGGKQNPTNSFKF